MPLISTAAAQPGFIWGVNFLTALPIRQLAFTMDSESPAASSLI
jgi:hypothetical protein